MPYFEDISDDVINKYMNGRCIYLACALHRITSCDIFAIICNNGNDYAHFFVSYDGNKYLDILGFDNTDIFITDRLKYITCENYEVCRIVSNFHEISYDDYDMYIARCILYKLMKYM